MAKKMYNERIQKLHDGDITCKWNIGNPMLLIPKPQIDAESETVPRLVAFKCGICNLVAGTNPFPTNHVLPSRNGL